MLLLNELYELESAELWIWWTGIPTGKTDRKYFCDRTFYADRRKEHGALGKASRWALHLTYFCLYQVSGALFIHNSDKKEHNWEVSYWFILDFPIYVDEKFETAQMICLRIC
jgi:hypothetical protein